MFICVVLTLLHVPVMTIYKQYSNYSEEATELVPKLMSLGNLGFSSTKCTTTGMAANKVILTCKIGMIADIVSLNIAAPFERKDLCINNATGVCANSYNQQLKHDLERCIG